jgi:hypothetical protein
MPLDCDRARRGQDGLATQRRSRPRHGARGIQADPATDLRLPHPSGHTCSSSHISNSPSAGALCLYPRSTRNVSNSAAAWKSDFMAVVSQTIAVARRGRMSWVASSVALRTQKHRRAARWLRRCRRCVWPHGVAAPARGPPPPNCESIAGQVVSLVRPSPYSTTPLAFRVARKAAVSRTGATRPGRRRGLPSRGCAGGWWFGWRGTGRA